MTDPVFNRHGRVELDFFEEILGDQDRSFSFPYDNGSEHILWKRVARASALPVDRKLVHAGLAVSEKNGLAELAVGHRRIEVHGSVDILVPETEFDDGQRRIGYGAGKPDGLPRGHFNRKRRREDDIGKIVDGNRGRLQPLFYCEGAKSTGRVVVLLVYPFRSDLQPVVTRLFV